MKLPSDIDDVCLKATEVWGQDAQEAVCIGELGEFLTLFGRRAQDRDTHAQWIDEIADIIIMAHQMANIHDREAVETRIAQKLARLKDRLGLPNH